MGPFIRNNHAGRRGTVSRLQKAHAERPAWDPSGAGLKCSEDVFGAVASFLCHDEDTDHDCYRAGECPKDGGSLDFEVDQQLPKKNSPVFPGSSFPLLSFLARGASQAMWSWGGGEGSG